MTDTPTAEVVVRQQSPASIPTTISGLQGALPDVLQLCNAIAGAGDLIPVSYRGKPGAVLLAKMWGDKHDVDLFTAVQQIYPIDGKPYVSAEMRVALATAKGFELRVTESTREVCTVEVWLGDHKRGEVTSRIEDVPESKFRSKNNKPTPWANHPDDMLFADACRKADRRYVRTAASMLDSAQDHDDATPNVIDVLVEGNRVWDPDTTSAVEDEEPASPEVEKLETAETIATDPVADLTAPPITEEQLRAAGTVGDLIKAAKRLTGKDVPLVAGIVEDQDLARAVLAEVQG